MRTKTSYCESVETNGGLDERADSRNWEHGSTDFGNDQSLLRSHTGIAVVFFRFFRLSRPVCIVYVENNAASEKTSNCLAQVSQAGCGNTKTIDVLKPVQVRLSATIMTEKHICCLDVHPRKCCKEGIQQAEVEGIVDVEECNDRLCEHHVDGS